MSSEIEGKLKIEGSFTHGGQIYFVLFCMIHIAKKIAMPYLEKEIIVGVLNYFSSQSFFQRLECVLLSGLGTNVTKIKTNQQLMWECTKMLHVCRI